MIKNIFIIIAIVCMTTSCARFQGNQVSKIEGQSQFSGKSALMTYSISKDATYGALGIFDDMLISEMERYRWKLRQNPMPKDGTPHLHVNLGKL